MRTPFQEETSDGFSTDGEVKVRRHVGKKPKEATPDHRGRPCTAGTRIALDALQEHNPLTGKPRLHLEPVFVDGYSAGTPHIINQVGRGTNPSASTPLGGYLNTSTMQDVRRRCTTPVFSGEVRDWKKNVQEWKQNL